MEEYMKETIKQQMSLETYKNIVRKELIRLVREKEVDSLMKSEDNLLGLYYEKNYGPEGVAVALKAGLL